MHPACQVDEVEESFAKYLIPLPKTQTTELGKKEGFV